jgi:hypothetical protein
MFSMTTRPQTTIEMTEADTNATIVRRFSCERAINEDTAAFPPLYIG